MTQNIRYGPIFDHWKKFDTLKVWEIASMMLGYEPRELTDIIVSSGDLLDQHGVPLDYSDEERMLTSAVSAGLLTACPSTPNCPNGNTEIAVASLIPWLRAKGIDALADELSSPTQNRAGHPTEQSDSGRRINALRALGGTVKWNAKQGYGWKFTGISQLVLQEKSEGYSRSDEKTIRADLRIAADAEKDAKAAGLFDGLTR